MAMATATRFKGQARGVHLTPWQKQRKQIEERERVARANPKYFNYKLNLI